MAQASPDGYTLLLGGTNPNAIAQSLYRNLNFEPLKDFTAVALIGLDSNALVVNPSVPAKTLQELVQYAKANPGKLTSGSTVGIGPHICLELFRARTGTDIAFNVRFDKARERSPQNREDFATVAADAADGVGGFFNS